MLGFPMPLRVPLGMSDFRKLREQEAEYIDKSHLLIELLDRATEVVLLPRPRRFGKTLNLSMLRYFFERRPEDLSHLFQDLSVWRAGEAYRKHFQRYPVISLSFREIKASTFEACWADLRQKIRSLFSEHQDLLAGRALSTYERRDFEAILGGTAEDALYRSALGDLSKYLHRQTNERAILLIDEYDEPIHAGFIHGYAKEVLEFFRSFLTVGLKDNPHLERGVVTGVLRIARESIFSGLNNLAVYSLLRPEFSTCFGFTEPEVEALLRKAGRLDDMETVRRWYNGYDFGGTVVYNPWSVLSFVAQEEREPQPFWLSTSSNDLIKELLEGRATRLQPVMEVLLAGGGIERVLDENVVLDQLARSDDALFGLLVFSGYLRAEKRSRGAMERAAHLLSIPNREVRELYAGTFRAWMEARMLGHGGDLDALTRALLGGDADALEEQLQAFAMNLLSYHDGAGASPEQLYHGFIVGLLAVLEPAYQVRSNRESGKGRPDVQIRPTRPGGPGVVLELKVARPGKKTPEQALEEGLDQIHRNDYGAELRAAGASPVHAFAVAFDGKRVAVKRAD